MISEVLPISETLSSMIARSASKDEMMQQAIQEGFVSMFENGMKKVVEGKTTIEEVLRVAKE
jgi:general secretion pathway protein E